MTESRASTLPPSLAVAVLTAVVMLATEPRMAIVWDEGYTLGREARIRLWFRALADPTRFAAQWRPPAEELVQQSRGIVPPRPDQIDTRAKLLFDTRVLAWFWPFAREEPHGHPPFYALLGLTGDLVPFAWNDLARARLGPILLFSLAAGAIYRFVADRFGHWPAALAAASWTLQPNLFGHGHYAAYDAVLTSLWALAIVAFTRAVEPDPNGAKKSFKPGWTLAFGVIAGCALATKLTGWFLPLPFLVWCALFRSRSGFKILAAGMLVAFVVLFALIPPWWTEPIHGLIRFFESNLTRAKTIPIPVLFLGTMYMTPVQSLPWYNTIVWTALVTPVGFLVLGALGFWVALRDWRIDPIGLLIIGNWLFLMMLRSLPHTPGHDGVRLFLPAFGILAILGGFGAKAVCEKWGRWGKGLIVAAIGESAVSLLIMMPVPLSYFSPLVCGLPGAAAVGMEPTYYWDGLDSASRRWLTENTKPGETIRFATFPLSWLYLRRTGELPRRIAPIDPGLPRWLVIQNRPGAFLDGDRAFVDRGHPAYVATKLGVPLIWIYPLSSEPDLGTPRKHDLE